MNLTKEQEAIVNSPINGVLVVKGAAGSGKTLVGLHRADFLAMSNNDFNLFQSDENFKVNEQIIFLSYERKMVNYLKNSMKELKGGNYYYNNTSLTFSTIDKLIYSLFYKNNSYNFKYKLYFNINDSIFKKIYEDLSPLSLSEYSYAFLKDEISWIAYRNSGFNREDYLNSTRKNPSTHKLIPPADKDTIFSLLVEYRKKLKEIGCIYIPDLYRYALKYFDKCIDKKEIDFTHIIVDEAQDLSEIKLEFIKKIYDSSTFKKKTITFLYDTAQTIFPNSYLGAGNSFRSLGFEIRGKTHILSKSYRTTSDIHKCAYELIKDIDIDEEGNKNKISFLNDTGIKPIFCDFNNEEEENNFIVEIIRLFKKNFKYKNKDFFVLSLKFPELLPKSYNKEDNIIFSSNENFNDDEVKCLAFKRV